MLKEKRVGGVVLSACLALLAFAPGCGEKDPFLEVMRARSEFEVTVQGSVPDKDGGHLFVELLVDKNGKTPLDQLTLRIEQSNQRGGLLRFTHQTIDVSSFRAYEAKQISLRVPLAGDDVHGVSVSVEGQPRKGVSYPELEGLEPAGQPGGH
jgi:hypothetical protein